MQKLFAFIFKYRVLFVFIGVEVFCLNLVFSKNNYQKSTFVNSTNAITGSALESKNSVSDYFSLSVKNKRLAYENAQLKEMVIRNNALVKFSTSKRENQELDKYRLYSAKVVNNSVNKQNNYLTINIGEAEGVEKGMGVVNDKGVVGIIISTSQRYSLVVSALHSQAMISSKISNSNTMGSVQWSGKTSKNFELKYIPRHAKFADGDTVVTSSYNAVFPENIIIGTIKNSDLQKNSSFYDIEVELIPNISELDYVYVVENIYKEEQIKLEEAIE